MAALCDISAPEHPSLLWLGVLVLEIVLRLSKTSRDRSVLNTCLQLLLYVIDIVVPNRIERGGNCGLVNCELKRTEVFKKDGEQKHN